MTALDITVAHVNVPLRPSIRIGTLGTLEHLLSLQRVLPLLYREIALGLNLSYFLSLESALLMPTGVGNIVLR